MPVGTGSRSRKLKRPYVRKQTINAPGIIAPTSPPQLSDLAFNIHGWALEDGMKGRTTYEVINAYNATMVKGGFEKKIFELREESQGEVYRTDLEYTSRELDPNLAQSDASVSQYLIIGYTLQEEDPIFVENKTFARYSENELVGVTRPGPANVILWRRVRTPILVVTPVKENTGTSVRLFGLLMPRSGLCQPVLITHERIFYRWEFRASTGARAAQRNKNWNQVVIDKARELRPPSMMEWDNYAADEEANDYLSASKRRRSSVVIKQEDQSTMWPEYTPERLDTSSSEVFELSLALDDFFEPLSERYRSTHTRHSPSLVTRASIVLTPESRGILNAIRLSRSSRTIQQIETSLARVSTRDKILPRTPGALQTFADLGVPLDIHSAELAGQEIKTTWPQLAHLADIQAILRVWHIMDDTQQTVDLALMEDFFRIMLAICHVFPEISDVELARRVQEAIQSALVLIHSPLDSDVDTDLGLDAKYLVTLLKELLVIHDWQRGKSHALTSEHVPSSFVGIEVEHRLEIPIEQVTGNLSQTLRYLTMSAERKNCGTEDILGWLGRLQLRIKSV